MAPRRYQTLLACLSLAICYLLWNRTRLSFAGGVPEVLRVSSGTPESDVQDIHSTPSDPGHTAVYSSHLSNSFRPGTPKTPGSNYTKTLIIARTKAENISWIEENFRQQIADGILKTAIYIADDEKAPLHPPKNKGHEVMIYLSYIIDNYDDLADVNMFMHSHRISWHNNELLDTDAVQIISRLSAERVQREGYMNLRCHWIPGCPDWMHPKPAHESYGKNEEIELAKAWIELFPLDSMPDVLAQPCCSQLAISRDRLRAVPRERFIFYRDWLLRTSLSDYVSGRVWEYLWQFVFSGHNINCPAEHVCYCDGYGICFGDEEAYKDWWKVWEQERIAREELRVWKEQTAAIQRAMKDSKLDEMAKLQVPEVGRDVQLDKEIAVLKAEMAKKRNDAIERGNDPKKRAAEVGREWHDGDGF